MAIEWLLSGYCVAIEWLQPGHDEKSALIVHDRWCLFYDRSRLKASTKRARVQSTILHHLAREGQLEEARRAAQKLAIEIYKND